MDKIDISLFCFNLGFKVKKASFSGFKVKRIYITKIRSYSYRDCDNCIWNIYELYSSKYL